ncbi:MAG: hypothetical protein PHC34_08495 [Candidatus Gastranaerophilales bacterium]|nr:hypothetical protein [Candidatus Gastranaerophilales bacterium]
MSQNHLILIVLIELFILYLIVYSIKVIRKWTNKKIEDCDELSADLPTSFRNIRKEMNSLNQNIKKNFIPQPLSTNEITTLFGEIFADLVKSKIPVFSIDKKFVILTTIVKLWKIRRRIIATFAQRFLKSAY